MLPDRFNLAEHLLGARIAEGAGRRPAIFTPEATLTYAEVASGAGRFAHLLGEAGVGRGDRVLIALPDGPAFVSAFFGTLAVGAVGAMLNPEVPLPEDVVVASEVSPEAHVEIRDISEVEPDEMILDIGPKTRQKFRTLMRDAGTIVWNGPVGVFEVEPFAAGTQAIADAIALSPAFSLAGGGDTLAAI